MPTRVLLLVSPGLVACATASDPNATECNLEVNGREGFSVEVWYPGTPSAQ
jgi:hypothetical protein